MHVPFATVQSLCKTMSLPVSLSFLRTNDQAYFVPRQVAKAILNTHKAGRTLASAHPGCRGPRNGNLKPCEARALFGKTSLWSGMHSGRSCFYSTCHHPLPNVLCPLRMTSYVLWHALRLNGLPCAAYGRRQMPHLCACAP